MLSRKATKQTFGSRMGSACGSRTESEQKVQLSWIHWRP